MKRRTSLKFSGRTPSALGRGGEDIAARPRAQVARAWAWRLAALLLVMCASNAWRRQSVGNTVPWPAARPLRIFDSSAPANATRPSPSSTWARARLVAVERGWGETFWALPTFAGEWAHRLAPREIGAQSAAAGTAWSIGVLWVPVLVWWGAAVALGLKRPSRGLALLVLGQVFGASYWLGSMRAPIRRLETASTCRAFDFSARTVASGGMLSPSQSIAWHRARGFAGLAFADANTELGSKTPSLAGEFSVIPSLRPGARQNPRQLLLADSPQNSLAIERAWWQQSSQSSEARARVSSVAIEAWSGSVGDEHLARQSRARGLAVVGSASLGAGSDCFVWTLVPADARTPSQVLAAIKNRRVAVAHALLESETPANLEARRQESRGLGFVLKSWREAISKLSRAQRLNGQLQVLVMLLALVVWGARAADVAEAPSGPQTVRRFLQRKRLLRRANGLAAMALAFAGSAWAAGLLGSFGGAFVVLLLWLALDALYLYGRSAWKRVH